MLTTANKHMLLSIGIQNESRENIFRSEFFFLLSFFREMEYVHLQRASRLVNAAAVVLISKSSCSYCRQSFRSDLQVFDWLLI